MGRCGALVLLFASFSLQAEPDKAKLRALLESGKFAELDAEMSAYQTAYREGRMGDEQASKAFIALKTNNPELRAAYDKWVADHPSSYAARLARGYYLMSLGYVARGGAYARETPRARLDDMRKLFGDAMADLEASLNLDPRPTLSFGTMIAITQGAVELPRAAGYLERAVAMDTNVYTARIAYLHSLRPEWGGSLEQMQAFIAQSERALAPEQLMRMKRVLQDSRARAELERVQPLVEQKQFEAALQLYDAALTKAPSAHGFVTRGRLLAGMNQHEKALADFDRALELDPEDNCCAHANRAYSHMMIGATGKAVPDLIFAAEDRDDHWAARQLAVMYGFGRYGMTPDPALAKRWCERAAKQGDPWSMYCMGGLYDAGMGVPRDSAMAARWFERAAERGVADAQADIAYMYWTGEGVAWNGLTALQWWMRAATQGNERARQKLISVAIGPALIILLIGLLGMVRHRRKANSR